MLGRVLPLVLCLASATARATPPPGSLAAHVASLDTASEEAEGWPVAPYRPIQDQLARLAELAATHPERLAAERIGRTVEERELWAFRVRAHAALPEGREPAKVLVFAGIHPMEWVSVEVASRWLEELAAYPPEGAEVTVVPIVNLDRRLEMEASLRAGRDRYFRTNAAGTDLNRDFAHNRESSAVWRHLIPARYVVSEAPLSQPETRALDALARAEGFDVVVSLHAFGGFFYTPWAGRWARMPAEDRQEHVRLGEIMGRAQGAFAYKTRQLSRWGFFFRGLGMEVDHFYAEHGATSFLVELTRSGWNPLRPATLRSDFRVYNPHNLHHHVEMGVSALRGLVGTLAWEARQGRPWPR